MTLYVPYVRKRLLNLNKNYMCFVTGETGSGKSEASIKLALEIDPDFTINHVVFSVQDLLKLLNTPGELKPGSVVVMDEAGVGVSSRDWMTRENKAMGKVAQTFRHRNLCLYWTVPTIDFVDIQLRTLGHGILVTDHINYKAELCYMKYYKIQYNPRSGDVYKKKHKFTMRGEVRVLSSIKIERPPMRLLKAYWKMKEDFTNKLNQESEELYEPEQKTIKQKYKSNEEYAQIVVKKHSNIIHKYAGRLTPKTAEIVRLFSIPLHRAEYVKSTVEKMVN